MGSTSANRNPCEAVAHIPYSTCTGRDLSFSERGDQDELILPSGFTYCFLDLSTFGNLHFPILFEFLNSCWRENMSIDADFVGVGPLGVQQAPRSAVQDARLWQALATFQRKT